MTEPQDAPAGPVLGEADRERYGRLVREAWVRWAQTQPNPKPSWLVPWEELSEPDREADRCIADALVSAAEQRGNAERADLYRSIREMEAKHRAACEGWERRLREETVAAERRGAERERELIVAALLAHDPVEWALAGQHAGSDAAEIARKASR